MNHLAPLTLRSQRGYALLVTLVMIALLGVILGGLARRSADAALLARDHEQAARERWAALSCTHTLLATAADRSDQRVSAWKASQQDGSDQLPAIESPIRSEAFSISMAGLDIWGRIDDEQAKINLNERLPASPDAAIMPQLVADAVLSPARTTGLRLTRQPFVQTLGLQPVMSWQQVFPDNTPYELLGITHPQQLIDANRSLAVANRVTLWGSGQLSLWTADDEVLRQRLSDSVQPDTINQLLVLRTAEPALPLGTLIAYAAEDRAEQALLGEALTEDSRCHAMWLGIRPAGHDDAKTRWSLWVVEQAGGEESNRMKAFRW